MGWVSAGASRRSGATRTSVAILSFLTAFSSLVGVLGIAAPARADSHHQVYDYQGLLAALGPAATGDIELMNGIKLGGPVTIGRNVTIYGSSALAEGTVVITAAGSSPALLVPAGRTATISNLAITGASDRKAKGGAISVEAGANLTLDAVSLYGNAAGEGAGLYNAGTTTINNSVFYLNSAAGKGGAVSNDGTLTVENSTFAKNDAQQGGAVSTAGAASFDYVTIVGNSSKNKIGAGTHLTGGSIDLKNSIVANNYSGGSFYDCSGQTNVLRVLFSSTQGCQPSGTLGVDYKVVPVITFPAGEVPQENGGPTRTVALVDQDQTTTGFQHPASGFGVSCVPVDQRGAPREQPAGCDIGAFERDQTPPSVSILTDPAANAEGWNSGLVSATLTATDDFEVSSLTYTVTGAESVPQTTVSASSVTVPIDAEGTSVVSAIASDREGNVSLLATRTVKIDTTAPVVTYQIAPDGSWVTFTVTDGLSGIGSFSVDGAPQTLSAGTVRVAPTELADQLAYLAVDKAGNEKAGTVDVAAPVVTIVPTPAGNQGWNRGSVTVDVTATDAGGTGVKTLTYGTAGAQTGPSATVNDASARFDVTAEGVTTVTASATDGDGNVGTAEPLVVKIDLTKPTVVAAQAAGANEGDIDVTLTASDGGSGVAKIWYQIDGEPPGSFVTSDSTTIAVSKIGTTTIQYLAEDVAGNQSLAATYQVTIDPLTLDVSLSASASSIEVGAVTVPLANIEGAIRAAAGDGTPIASTPLSAIPLSAIPLSAIGLGATPLSAIPLSAIPLSAIPLSAIGVDGTPLSAIPLSAIPLSAIPLSAIPLSAIPLSAIPLEGTPLSAIPLSAILLSDIGSNLLADLVGDSFTDLDQSLEDLLDGTHLQSAPLQALTFGDLIAAPLSAIDFAVSPLSAIPLSAIPLSAIGDVIDCTATGLDCTTGTLGDVAGSLLPGATVGDVIGLDDVGLGSTPLSAIPLSAISLGTLPLSAIPLSAIDTGGNELTGLDAWCYYLGTVCSDLGIPSTTDPVDNDVSLMTLALAGVPLSAIPLSAIPLSAIPLSAIPLSAIPLSAINWASTPLSAIPLSAIPLSAIGDLFDCTVVDCADSTLTIGQIADSGGINTTATIGLLEGAIPDGYSLADLLYGFLSPQAIPWQELDLNASRLPDAADPKQPSFTYTATVTVGGARTATVDVVVDIPDGFVPAYDVAEPLLDDVAVARPVEAGGVLTFAGLTLSPGSHDLVVPMRAGIVLGTFEASVTASGSALGTPSASAGPATTSITVVEAGEGAGPIPLIQDGNLELSHISYSDDIDLYGFSVGPELAGVSARILLSNLPADYDLVLYGPPLQAPLRSDPQVGYGTVEDFRYDLNPDDDTLDTEALEDVPNDPPAGSVLHAISGTRGTNDEEIVTGTLREGDYYIQVSSYNGVSSNDPFALRVRLEGSALGACGVLPLRTAAVPAASLPGSYPSGLNTLFLYNGAWLQDTYGDAGQVLTALAGLGDPSWTDLGVIATAVPVDADPNVWSALQAWDAERCDPGAANDVVRAIGSLIDGITASLPSDTIENIVIVGDDSQIPFARIPDGVAVSNETDHGRTIADDGELKRALAGGFYFSDDPYGADRGISVADHEFFVPRRAVGRLVESPSDIVGAMSNFVGYGGVLDTSTGAFAAASGYDFLADGTAEVIDNLAAGGFSVNSLNDPALWTRQDLISLLSAGNLSVASINAHFDESRALPALGNSTGDETDLFTVNDLPSSLVDAVIFSMGCHSGLSVSDVQIGSPSPDWAQSHAGLGNLYAANSGYGYGDTQVVAYSEEISAYFAEYLSTMPVGQAWVAAKQRFASQLFTLTPYHEKVSQEFVFYGLPMFTTFAPAPAVAAFVPAATTTTFDPGPTVIADPFGDGVVAPVGIDLVVSPTSGPGALHEVTTTEGSYYEVDGEKLLVRGRPVQPLAGLDVTRPDGAGGLVAEAGGAIITGLEGYQVPGFDPLVFNPIVDLGDGEDPSLSSGPRFQPGDATFPAGLQRVVSYVDETGQPRQRLLVVPGRYRADGSVQELFTGIEALVHYRDPLSTDFKAPFIRQSIGRYGGGIVHFEVDVRGDGPVGSDDVERVYVLYRPKGETGPVVWQGVDLARVPGTNTWLGGRPVDPFTGSDFEFFVQAVDGNGNVASATSKGVNFLTVQPGSDASIGITVSGATKSATGWYDGAVTATATSQNDVIDSYVLDGISGTGNGTASQSFPISGDGGHLLLVFDSTGRLGILFVAIDATAPIVSASVVPDAGGGWIGTSGLVTINAFDPFGSGVVRVEYSVDGGQTWTAVEDSSATVTVSDTTTVLYRATDGVGNTSAEGSLSVQVDTSPPIVQASVSPAPNAAGWVNAPASVTISADDEARSGVFSIEYSLDGGATWDTYTLPVPVTAQGMTTVIYRATDNVGNVSVPDSIGVNLDSIAPTVDIAGPVGSYGVGDVVNASYECADEGSGIASCSGDVASGGSIDTSKIGDFTFTVTATDAAGNTTVATSTYSVVDATYPVVTITSPADGATYLVGAPLTAAYACTDDSGSCTITSAVIGATSYANGATIPTTTPGTYTLVVTAVDGAGNVATASATFTVEWRICLLYDPDNAQPITGAVAIKVQICDVNGVNKSSAAHILTATVLEYPDGTTVTTSPQYSGKANDAPTYDFRYDAKLKGYIYNLNEDPTKLFPSTSYPPPGYYHFHFTVDGQGDYLARFTLK